MSGFEKVDPFIIAVGSVFERGDITKQQLVEALMLVFNGKIQLSWEQSYGMTSQKTELIQAIKELSLLTFNGSDAVDDTFKKPIQKILEKLTVFKRMVANREKAAREAEAKAAQEALASSGGAIPPPNTP